MSELIPEGWQPPPVFYHEMNEKFRREREREFENRLPLYPPEEKEEVQL